ncbi:NAD-dependent epimerase/dehydratase [Nitrosotalea devaniterrae]|uniref:NAD-dependent epimerase/dehydratase n=1 Tax=Nitrosotalea devaniterrae TaxID=1078905 RepID=A0A128A0X1_9ARCH|nr:NAD-dependent epimerase/dehydratase [Candidatus Nitrosotalea devanaterra]
MKRRAVVTGGAGFIGSHLTKKLHQKGYDVLVYDDLSNGSGISNIPREVCIKKDNILNPNNLRSAFRKADVVFHLAVKPLTMSFDKPEEVVRVNDYGSYLVAKTCSDLKIKLIHVSSSEVYGTALHIPMREDHPLFPSTIYAGSKAAADLYVKGFEKTENLKAVTVRPFNSYGEFMRDDTYAAVIPNFFRRISNNQSPIIFGNGKQTRDFTYVDDTCEGIMLADQSSNFIGETFNIGSGKEASVLNIAKIMIKKFQDITGKEIDSKITFKQERKGDVKRHLASISHARKVLGYKPKVKLEEGITRYLIWKMNRKLK